MNPVPASEYHTYHMPAGQAGRIIMDIRELTELLAESSECYNQAKWIPWWDATGEGGDDFDEYTVFSKQTVEDANACVAACAKAELLAPAGQLGLTLFHLLVWHNFYDAVEQAFLDGKADADAANLADCKGQGLTPFLLSCAQGNLAMARLLLAHGADGSLCDKRGMNAYHFLAYPGFESLAMDSSCLGKGAEQRGEIARLLTCDINRRNADGLTPLELLLSHEYSSGYTWPLAEIFLEKGAKTDYVDGDGNTLLMLARRNGHITAALQLMKRCPELLDVANKNGVTPLRHAADFRNEAMYFALQEHGAKPDPEASLELYPLSQLAGNSFSDISDDNRDALSMAMYLTSKLMARMDPDDDDEIGEITELLHNALNADREGRLLDMCKDMKIDFTAPIYYSGEMLCLRDECLSSAYGVSVLKKLAAFGVDMDRAVIKGRTPANIIASLRKREYKKDEAFFQEAASFFSLESMEQADNNGRAAVHLAAEMGHEGMLRAMIEKGVNVNLTQDAPGDAGATALHCACTRGLTDVVRLLIAAGADDTLANLNGETPAHYAVLPKSLGGGFTAEKTAGLLKELKSIDIPREDGRTPVMLLKDFGPDNMLLSLFLERGADVNHADQNGVTLLMLHTDKDTAKILLGAGADINMADSEGNTALHYALECCSEGDARYLVKKGADYNRLNSRGVTPAQLAAENGMDTVLELMTDIR